MVGWSPFFFGLSNSIWLSVLRSGIPLVFCRSFSIRTGKAHAATDRDFYQEQGFAFFQIPFGKDKILRLRMLF